MEIEKLKKGNELLSLIEKTKGNLKQLDYQPLENTKCYLSLPNNTLFEIPKKVIEMIQQIIISEYKLIISEKEKELEEL
jgi:hypothetical protein